MHLAHSLARLHRTGEVLIGQSEAWSVSVQTGIREQGDTSSETMLIEEIKQDEGGIFLNLTAEK